MLRGGTELTVKEAPCSARGQALAVCSGPVGVPGGLVRVLAGREWRAEHPGRALSRALTTEYRQTPQATVPVHPGPAPAEHTGILASFQGGAAPQSPASSDRC